MKRIYLLLVLLVAASTTTFAQRSINLEVTLVSPTSSQTIQNGTPVDIKAIVKNLGPDSLRMSDSTTWFMTISGTPVNFTFNGQTGAYWNRFNRSLKVNDTMHFTFNNRSLSYSQTVDSNRTICFVAVPNFDGGGNDTISDGTLSNNSDCVSVLFKAGSPSGIEEILITEAGVNKATIYPNPAHQTATVAVNMQYSADVEVALFDITGRQVLNTTESLEKGTHEVALDINKLQTGIYIYKVKMGNNVSSGKLTVTK